MGKAKDFFGKVKNMWDHAPEGRFLCIKEIGALGLYGMGTSAFYNLMLFNFVTVIFIPYYYHIPAVHAYGILLIGNFLNMIMQPIIGNAMERTNTKIGRYKPYVIGIIPFLVIFTILATMVPTGLTQTANIIYAYLTCIPSIFLTNFAYNMYQTMPTVITSNAQERDDVMSPIGILFGLMPSILLLILPVIRGVFMDKGQEEWAIRIFGIIVSVVGGLAMLFVLRLRERVVTATVQTEDSKITMKQAAKMLSKNKPLWIMSVALCLGALREFWRFFSPMFAQVRFAEEISYALKVSGVPLTIMGLGVTIAMVIMPILTRKLNKNGVIIVLTLFNGVATLLAGAIGFQRVPIGPASIATQTILFIIASLGNGVLIMLPMIIGDIADYQQAISGKRLEGHIQNFIVTIPLLFAQVVMFALSFLQESIGFEPGDYTADVTTTYYDATQQAIACKWFNIVCIISAVSSFLMILVLFFYPLTKKKHQECVDLIKEKYGIDVENDEKEEVAVTSAEAVEDAIVPNAEIAIALAEELEESVEDEIKEHEAVVEEPIEKGDEPPTEENQTDVAETSVEDNKETEEK